MDDEPASPKDTIGILGDDAAAEPTGESGLVEEVKVDEGFGGDDDAVVTPDRVDKKRSREEAGEEMVDTEKQAQKQHQQQTLLESRTDDEEEKKRRKTVDEVKRAKVLSAQQCRLTHVLRVSNIPSDTTDEELVALVTPHGGKISYLVMCNDNSAMIQVDSIECAAKMVVHYSELESPAIVRGEIVFIETSPLKELSSGRHPVGAELLHAATGGAGISDKILMVVFSNVVHVIDVNVLEKVFGPCGTLSKVVIFSKSGKTMALVQYLTSEGASKAYNTLNGQNIYAGCCGMSLSFSQSRDDLVVRQNTPMAKDFLVPDASPRGGSQGALLDAPSPYHRDSYMPRGDYRSDRDYKGSSNRYGRDDTARYGLERRGGGGGGADGTVVIISHLDQQRCTPDYLFKLFGVYGDVMRVKIMFKKRDTALVQFTDKGGAQRAIRYLDGFALWDRKINVNISTHDIVQMPDEQTPFALEYGFNHVLHRFKRDGKNLQYITEPNTVLHISSIPLDANEDDIKALLSHYGQVTLFKFLKDGKFRQALATMGTIQQATDALVSLHNKELAPRVYLKLNFSVAGSSLSKEDRIAQQQRYPTYQGGTSDYHHGNSSRMGDSSGYPSRHQQQQQQAYNRRDRYNPGYPRREGSGYSSGRSRHGAAPQDYGRHEGRGGSIRGHQPQSHYQQPTMHMQHGAPPPQRHHYPQQQQQQQQQQHGAYMGQPHIQHQGPPQPPSQLPTQGQQQGWRMQQQQQQQSPYMGAPPPPATPYWSGGSAYQQQAYSKYYANFAKK